MEDKIEVAIEYLERDIRQSVKFYCRHVHATGNLFWCFIGLPIVMLAISLFVMDSGALWVYSLLVSVICLVFLYIYFIRPVNKYVEFYMKDGSRTYIFADDSVTIVKEKVKSECGWDMFKRAVVTPYSLLLIDENKMIYLLPKGYFPR